MRRKNDARSWRFANVTSRGCRAARAGAEETDARALFKCLPEIAGPACRSGQGTRPRLYIIRRPAESAMARVLFACRSARALALVAALRIAAAAGPWSVGCGDRGRYPFRRTAVPDGVHAGAGAGGLLGAPFHPWRHLPAMRWGAGRPWTVICRFAADLCCSTLVSCAGRASSLPMSGSVLNETAAIVAVALNSCLTLCRHARGCRSLGCRSETCPGRSGMTWLTRIRACRPAPACALIWPRYRDPACRSAGRSCWSSN